MSTKPDPKKPVKAAYAGLVTAITSTTFALADGHITLVEGLGIALATVLTVGGTYGLRNPQVPAGPED